MNQTYSNGVKLTAFEAQIIQKMKGHDGVIKWLSTINHETRALSRLEKKGAVRRIGGAKLGPDTEWHLPGKKERRGD